MEDSVIIEEVFERNLCDEILKEMGYDTRYLLNIKDDFKDNLGKLLGLSNPYAYSTEELLNEIKKHL